MIALAIEKLERDHEVEGFDCGKEPLNRFLTRYALNNQRANASQTYVAVEGKRVIGYHTLVVGEVEFESAPERLKKGLAHYPVPLVVLARLAIRTDRQGQGLGSGLLKDALLRTLQAADIVGVRALAVHAMDEAARMFYEHFDFRPSATDPLHLFLLLKDINAETANR